MSDERELIREYQDAVRGIVSALRRGFGRDDFLSATRRGEVPKEGSIGKVEFSFHGVGCRGTKDGVEVDFDFGPDGRTDGFDAWRVWDFAKKNAAKYPTFQDCESVDEAMRRLERSGEIECPHTAPSPHLWYWRS